MFDDFGGRVPSDKPPIKTPGELAIERGEPWPKPVARAGVQGGDRRGLPGRRGSGTTEWLERCWHQRKSIGRAHTARLRRPGRLARAGLAAARQPAGQHPQGHWYPPQWQPPYPPYQPYPYPGPPPPHGGPTGAPAPSNEDAGQESNRPNPPTHG